MRIITVPTKNTRVVTVLVLVGTGSKHEEKNLSGISHFLEHMFFKKTKKRPSKIKIAEDMDSVGGLYNAFTTEECTGYYAKADSSKFSLVLDWVSDIYLNSLLPEEEVKKECNVIKEEINMYYDSPMHYCQILFQQLLYGDQPAGRDIAGTKKTVSSIKREDLLEYMISQYKAQNTVVVVAGNVKKKEAEKKVEDAFSNIREGSPKKSLPVKEKQSKPEALVYHRDTDQTHLCFGARGFNSFHKYRFTQDIIAAILGGMMSSRLFIKIREELGLAYYVRTQAEDNPDTGVVFTRAGVDSSKAKQAIEVIKKEYERMKKESVSPKELAKAKEHLKGKLSIVLEPSDALAHFYGISELLEGRVRSLEEVFSKIDSISSKEIKEASKEIFRPENLNLAVVGPHKTKRPFEKLLK